MWLLHLPPPYYSKYYLKIKIYIIFGSCALIIINGNIKDFSIILHLLLLLLSVKMYNIALN